MKNREPGSAMPKLERSPLKAIIAQPFPQALILWDSHGSCSSCWIHIPSSSFNYSAFQGGTISLLSGLECFLKEKSGPF